MSLLSVVVPIYNDLDGVWMQKILARLDRIESIEVICVDSTSLRERNLRHTEKTNYTHKVVYFETLSRGARLQAGIDASTGTTILLHHPRSLVSVEGLEWLRNQANNREESSSTWSWGGFTHEFDLEHFLLRFTSWYSNNIRARCGGILYLDHCIFFRKSALGSMRIPPVEIFEDTELSRILLANTSQKPYIAPYPSTTSAVRFATNGILRQSAMNQWLKLRYWLGELDGDGVAMNSAYEQGLNLNGAAALDGDTGALSKRRGRGKSTQIESLVFLATCALALGAGVFFCSNYHSNFVASFALGDSTV
jgi:hypothetical protein